MALLIVNLDRMIGNAQMWRDTFAAQLPDLIETENYRVDSSAKTSDGLGDEHLGARNLHDVEHEADSDGMGQRAAP